jgi:hypothetical protein
VNYELHLQRTEHTSGKVYIFSRKPSHAECIYLADDAPYTVKPCPDSYASDDATLGLARRNLAASQSRKIAK